MENNLKKLPPLERKPDGFSVPHDPSTAETGKRLDSPGMLQL